MSGKLTGRCAVCGERVQRNGEGVPWRHQRPQPSGKPHDHVPTLATDRSMNTIEDLKPIPVDPRVHPQIAAHNETHEQHGRYNGTRLHQTCNGVDDVECVNFPELLRYAADLIENYGTDPLVLADLHSFLRNSHWYLPKVQAWCIVKVYGETDPNSAWFGKTAVSYAFLTKKQAENFLPAVINHNNKDRRTPSRDTFEVRWTDAGIINFLRPDLTVEMFKNSR